MAKTYQNLIDEARTLLQDTDATDNRYTDSDLLEHLNRGLQEIARIRPDAYWDAFDTDDIVVAEIVTTDSDPDDDTELGLSADFALPMQFYSTLVYFVVASAEIVDDEFTTEGRAMQLMTQFKNQLLAL
jgi:hypothetical protein